MVAEVTEGSKHKMEVQEEYIVEVLVPMRNWCDSPNYGCKPYHMVNSSIGFYSPSWTYIHLTILNWFPYSLDIWCDYWFM